MKRFKNISKGLTFVNSPVWFLRAGLGLVYLYSGSHILANPMEWSGYLPPFLLEWIAGIMPVEVYMRIQGGGELLMGLLLLIWFTPRLVVAAVAGISALEMLGILVLVGIDTVTFRDIGLLGASLSLLLFSLLERDSLRRH